MSGIKVKTAVHFKSGRQSRKEMQLGDAPVPMAHRVPRVAKLMALAILFEGLIQGGVVADYAELARLGHVTRARITQLMGLLNLAPNIIEVILHLEPVQHGKDPITERELRSIVAVADWKVQRQMWEAIQSIGQGG